MNCSQLYIIHTRKAAAQEMRIRVAKNTQCANCFESLETGINYYIDGVPHEFDRKTG
ncbi:hypothetical protein PTKU64_92590 (plasmid) [Paraburkholderia terrae]|uniref:Uncharacterized protein n=1 Tax=Paraburkholderia terrae TaxID=311230 RepID=A0ABM7U3M7_9BURK|nr:hypothetical protein PTKU64_92590 [Paraburkholderia terrae]